MRFRFYALVKQGPIQDLPTQSWSALRPSHPLSISDLSLFLSPSASLGLCFYLHLLVSVPAPSFLHVSRVFTVPFHLTSFLYVHLVLPVGLSPALHTCINCPDATLGQESPHPSTCSNCPCLGSRTRRFSYCYRTRMLLFLPPPTQNE